MVYSTQLLLQKTVVLSALSVTLFAFVNYLTITTTHLPLLVHDKAKPTLTTFEDNKEKNLHQSIPQVKEINNQISAMWEEYGLSPSPYATDGEWCRRVHLDLIGRVPTVTELREFLNDNKVDKKQRLVEKLLSDPAYEPLFAENFTNVWTNILIGRAGGTERNSLTNRQGMRDYLYESFLTNKPYDTLVYELISATGTNAPDKENFNGAVNFLTMKLDEDGVLATAKTSQIFLGLQIQCAQCHNHPFNDWKQEKFWELNAFFRQARPLRRFEPGTRDVTHVELGDQDFVGEGSTPEDAEIYYELRNGLLKVAYPTFIDGTTIPRSGYVSDVNRREELAKLVISSDWLEKAAVNRFWGHFFGHGFTKPVDDMGPHNQASHPELHDYLAVELRKNSFNLRELIQWIVLSEPYSLSSRSTRKNKTDDPLLGEPPKFSHFYIRQMSAEQLFDSLLIASEAERSRGDRKEQEQARNRWLRQFVSAFGNDEGLETTTFNGTIPQTLMMFNGDLTNAATRLQGENLLNKVANSDMTNLEKITYLFQAGLARNPTRSEIGIANQVLNARDGDIPATMQDLWWAILNSNQFILNH
ncbi:MAG: DUF1549 and DUF1553 domain-containing protein [Pirellulaceae bacterium]|nr:DUF1549 and DUF1553 domain-containing protein [Pirellulaceae bacterium]